MRACGDELGDLLCTRTAFGRDETVEVGYRGVVALMAAAHTNPDSALYVACAAVHSASARLLLRAQAGGTARADMNGDDLFALMAALGWAVDQPSFAPRADSLVHIIEGAILTNV